MKSEHEQPPVCPVCNRSDMVIPIVYGFPGEELFEESEKGLVMLGGCCVGEIIGFNFRADAANDDWIRATRLKQVVIGLNNFLKLIEKG